MIVVDFGSYVGKIHHDHGNTRFGRTGNRITVGFCWPLPARTDTWLARGAGGAVLTTHLGRAILMRH
jgi:hypothetical protein